MSKEKEKVEKAIEQAEKLIYTAAEAATEEPTLEKIQKAMDQFKDKDARSLAELQLTGLPVVVDDNLSGFQQEVHVSPEMYKAMKEKLAEMAVAAGVEPVRLWGMDVYPSFEIVGMMDSKD